MTTPLFVRELTAAETAALRRGLRSTDAFTMRRSQVLLASAAGQTPRQIATSLACATQTVRDAIRAFVARGVACLKAGSKVAKVLHRSWPHERDDDLKTLLHRSPRLYDKPTSLWTLALTAEVCHEQGWTARALSAEAIRQVLLRLKVGWKRAKHWITSPDPEYAAKKNCATA